MIWWLAKFNGCPLPRGNFSTDLSRALTNEQAPAIGSQGVYWLNGARPLLGAQNYTYEYTISDKQTNAHVDALMAAALAEGDLYKSDGLITLDTVARLSAITDVSAIGDLHARQKTIRLTFVAEPFWYGATHVLTRENKATRDEFASPFANLGNAPAIKHTRFDLVSAATAASEIITIDDAGVLYTTATITPIGIETFYVDAGIPEAISATNGDMWQRVTRPATQLPLLAIPPARRIGGQLDPTWRWGVTITGSSSLIGTYTFRDTYL